MSARITIARCDLVQHWRKKNEILATDQRHLYVRSTWSCLSKCIAAYSPANPPLAVTIRVVSSRDRDRNAIRVINILLRASIIQSFSHLFLKLTALKISLNFASTNDSQTSLPSLSFSANH